MTTFTWPSGIIADPGSQWAVKYAGMLFRSPFSGHTVGRDTWGGGWQAQIVIDDLDPDLSQDLDGLLNALRGVTNAIQMPDHGYAGCRGGVAGRTLTATGAVQSYFITLAGAVPGQAKAVRRGDRFGIGGRMYVATADQDATGGGSLTNLPISPPLRATYASAAVELVTPTVPMKFIDFNQNWKTERAAGFCSFAFSIVEDLPRS